MTLNKILGSLYLAASLALPAEGLAEGDSLKDYLKSNPNVPVVIEKEYTQKDSTNDIINNSEESNNQMNNFYDFFCSRTNPEKPEVFIVKKDYLNTRLVHCKKGRAEGKQLEWDKTGKLESEENYMNGQKEGKRFVWHQNGQKAREENYMNGSLEGKQSGWYENGRKESEMNFVNGQPEGKHIFWYENGQKWWEKNFVKGRRVSEQCWDEKGKPKECSR